jgi:hypothetical protein
MFSALESPSFVVSRVVYYMENSFFLVDASLCVSSRMYDKFGYHHAPPHNPRRSCNSVDEFNIFIGLSNQTRTLPPCLHGSTNMAPGVCAQIECANRKALDPLRRRFGDIEQYPQQTITQRSRTCACSCAFDSYTAWHRICSTNFPNVTFK